jgi:hypothetical protein
MKTLMISLALTFTTTLALAEDKPKCEITFTFRDGAMIKTRRCTVLQGDKNGAPPTKVVNPDQYQVPGQAPVTQ